MLEKEDKKGAFLSYISPITFTVTLETIVQVSLFRPLLDSLFLMGLDTPIVQITHIGVHATWVGDPFSRNNTAPFARHFVVRAYTHA